MGPLAQIFSTAEGVKRKLVDALRNPRDAAAQFVGNQADRARNLQGMTAAATDEFVNTGSLRGPEQARLDQMIAEAYNPIGMVGVTGPRSEALETARRNAVKILGLPENNTAMDRAKALGFAEPVYRGSKSNEIYQSGPKWVTDSPQAANYYAGHVVQDEFFPMLARHEGGNVMPLLSKQSAINQGSALDLAEGGSRYLVEPSILRSRFAAFDPARVNENDLLGRASLPFLGLLGIGAGGAAYLNKDSQQP